MTDSMTTLPPVAATTSRRHSLIGDSRAFQRDRLGMLLRLSKECGDIGPVRLGPRSNVVFANSSETVGALLVQHGDDVRKGKSLRLYLRPVIGDGLLGSDPAIHRQRRKIVAPAFRPGRVADYADVMVRRSSEAQRSWRDGATVDVARAMTRLTLGIIGELLFSADLLDQADALSVSLLVALRYASSQLAAPLHLPLSWPTPGHIRVRRAIDRLDRTIYRMIAERRVSDTDTGDLLSVLLLARAEDDGSQLSDVQVRDEAMTLFTAGHETVAAGLAWTWMLLMEHPDVYERLRSEVDEALDGRPPTADDLPRLPYALQVFKESLRLYPPAYILSRQTICDVDLAGYVVPADKVVIVCPYTLHRRPDYFTDPERFDPERFSLEAERRLPRHAYLPFGAGSRVCLGNHFALMEGQLLLAALAQSVTFVPLGHRSDPEPGMNLRPQTPIMARINRRIP